jgi:hypothetical protein
MNHPTMPVQRQTKGELLIKTMPLIRYATHETHINDQDDTSLAAQLKRNARVAVPAQAGSRPPVSNQTPLMHLYGRHPRSRNANQPPARLKSEASNQKPCSTPKCTARYEEKNLHLTIVVWFGCLKRHPPWPITDSRCASRPQPSHTTTSDPSGNENDL